MQIYTLEDTLPVVDLSSTGIGFKPMTEKFAVGDALEFDLLAYGVLKIRGMKADVVRFNKIVVGAHFQKLSPRQAKQLEVILEGAAASAAQ